jgi:hypothetical protein
LVRFFKRSVRDWLSYHWVEVSCILFFMLAVGLVFLRLYVGKYGPLEGSIGALFGCCFIMGYFWLRMYVGLPPN